MPKLVALSTLALQSNFKFADDEDGPGRRGVVVGNGPTGARIRIWKKSPTKKNPDNEVLDYPILIAGSALVEELPSTPT